MKKAISALLVLYLTGGLSCPASSQLLPDTFVVTPQGPSLAEILNKNNPRRTYSLDGQWEFKIDGEIHWRTARVPGSWQMDYPDLRDYSGSVEFRKSITIPPTFRNDAWLILGAADYAVRVSVNGRYAASWESGYLPIAVNLAPFGKASDTVQVSIVVDDPTQEKPLKSYPYAETPQGLQHRFGYVGGLWQSVYLEERPSTFVEATRVTPDLKASAATVEVILNDTPPDAQGTLYATVYAEKTNAPVFQYKADLTSQTSYRFKAQISNPMLWSPEEPHLYTLNVSIETEAGTKVDQYLTRFGMRSLEAREGKLYLNGDPFFIRGALDNGYYPETLYTPPSEEFLIQQVSKAKQLGFNLLRVRSKIPDPLYLRAADEAGMLIWYELPSVQQLTPNSRKRLAKLMEGAARRDYNSPSFCILSITRDSVGVDTGNSDHVKWLGSAYDFAKKLLPDRLIVDNSSSEVSAQIKADLLDVSAPIPADNFNELITSVDSAGSHPVILTGIGHWGLPLTTALSACYQSGVPYWWDSGTSYLNAYNTEQRFRQMSLATLFGDYARFARSTQEVQLERVKTEIEDVRIMPMVSGYILDQLADTYAESSGILDVCRNLKVSSRMMGYVQQNTVLVSQPVASSQPSLAQVALISSNFGPVVPAGSKISWALEGFPDVKGSMIVDGLVVSGVSEIAQISLPLPEVTNPRDTRLLLRWTVGEQVVAQNYLDMELWPGDSKNLNPLSYFVADEVANSSVLESWLQTQGGRIAESILSCDILITNQITEPVEAFVEQGGRVILLVNSAAAKLPEGLTLRNLQTTQLPENAAFDWMDGNVFPSAVPARGQFFSWELTGMLPDFVINGVTGDAWQQVEAGRFYGWVREGEAYTIKVSRKSGRLIVTTIPISDAITNSPVAQKLMYRYVNLISATEFATTAILP